MTLNTARRPAMDGVAEWLRWIFGCVLLALLLGLSSHSHAQTGAGERNAALIRERQALHIGTTAYLYGYSIVDMRKQMFNETHRVTDK